MSREPKRQGGRNWNDLPDEVTASILSRLSMFDILERAQRLCLTWRRICKDPLTWSTIRMEFHIHLRQHKINGNFTSDEKKEHLREFHNFNANKMCHHAIHISFGNLVDISIQNCGTDELLQHITDSSRAIRRLRIVFSSYITMEGLSKVASKMLLLEDLEISYTSENRIPPFRYTQHKYLEVIGRACPLLKTLRWNKHEGCFIEPEDNGDAFAIARTMHGLQNLQLFGNRLNHKGFCAILEGCPRLESLDLRKCTRLHSLGGWRASLEEDLKTRCPEQRKKLRLPQDSTDDYEHSAIHRIVDLEYDKYLVQQYM